MKAIILAAGEGHRLAAAGWNKPKCLLPLNERTLLDNLMLSLIENGIQEAAIVVGYEKELVMGTASAHNLRITYFENPDYSNTNTVNSLWRAAQFANDDIIYFNADVLFDRCIVTRLIAHQGSALAIEIKPCGEEEVKVILDTDDRIVHIGKKLDPADCAGEFIGIGVFRREVWPDFLEALHYYNEVTKQRDLFFEAAVDRICSKNVIRGVDVAPYSVIEIDTPEDLKAAKQMAKSING
jgi:choline kinase